jgi:nicotinamide-nucleotide amidase
MKPAHKNAENNGEIICEILCIGREILDGRVIDTNSTSIAQALEPCGLRAQYAQKVDDDAIRVRDAFQLAASRSDFVFVSGGLGPTSDDRTLEIFAKFIGQPMTEYPDARLHLEKILRERNRAVNESQLKQIHYPQGGRTIPNPFGTACGFDIEVQGTRWFFLPGPPRELVPMLEAYVAPAMGKPRSTRSEYWVTEFTPEANIQELLKNFIAKLPSDWDLSFQARFPEVVVGLHAPENSTEKEFGDRKDQISQALAGHYWYQGLHSRLKIEEALVEALKNKNAMLVTIESCTGGLIAERITDVSGSSDVFLGSWVTYANEAKEALGVNPETIRKFGAVSKETSLEMSAAGLRAAQQMCPETRILAISTTGIAGPLGGSPEKPVGLCFTSLADSANKCDSEKIEASPKLDRGSLRRYFAQKALSLALSSLK